MLFADQYVACMRLSVGSPDGTTRWIEAGEPIDGFETWPYIVRDSLLRLGRVKKHGLMQTANLSVKGGYLHFETPEEAAAQQLAAAAPPSEAEVLATPQPATKRGRRPKALATP